MQTSLILWDWNGTLLNDVQLGLDSLNRNLARFGYPQQYDLQTYRQIFGFPIQDYYIRAGFDFSRHPFPVLAEAYMQDYLPACEACGLYADAETALQKMQALGIRQSILSACPRTELEAQVTCRGIRPCFDQLLGLEDIYARSKLEIGLAYLSKSGFDPAQVVCVGDSIHDYEVSRALGTRCVLFGGGHQARERLEATGAAVIDRLTDLPEML